MRSKRYLFIRLWNLFNFFLQIFKFPTGRSWISIRIGGRSGLSHGREVHGHIAVSIASVETVEKISQFPFKQNSRLQVFRNLTKFLEFNSETGFAKIIENLFLAKIHFVNFKIFIV